MLSDWLYAQNNLIYAAKKHLGLLETKVLKTFQFDEHHLMFAINYYDMIH